MAIRCKIAPAILAALTLLAPATTSFARQTSAAPASSSPQTSSPQTSRRTSGTTSTGSSASGAGAASNGAQRGAGNSSAPSGANAQKGAASSNAPAGADARQGASTDAQKNSALQQTVAQAQAALDRNDFSSAIPLLQQIIAARPAEPLPHFELGFAYSELKRFGEASAEYRHAIDLNPALAPAHLNLGLVLLDSEPSDPAAALAEFRKAGELQPDQARPHYLAGEALEKANKPDDAIAEYQAAVKLSPNDASMRFTLGRALLGANQAAEAETQFHAAIAAQSSPQNTAPTSPSTPSSASALSSSASSPVASSSTATGAAANRASADAIAAMKQAKLGLAEALLRENKPSEAADAFAAYLADAPNDPAARVQRAAVLQDTGKLDEALAELDKADTAFNGPSPGTTTSGPSSDSLKLRGNIYMQQQKWMDAATALDRAAMLTPGDAEVHAWLGHARMELRDYTAARNELERAFMLDKTNLEPAHELVAVYYLSGDFPGAIVETDLLASRQALIAGDWFFRALSCDKLGKKEDAETAYRKFVEVDAGKHADQDWQAQQRLLTLQHETKK